MSSSFTIKCVDSRTAGCGLNALCSSAIDSSTAHRLCTQVRAADKVDGAGVQGYGLGIHSDTSSAAAKDTFSKHVGKMPEECRQGRFLYINAWRNIADAPIEDHHLACCDEGSLVSPDDYVDRNLYGHGYKIKQFGLCPANAAKHRWWYYSAMTKDEVLLFKQVTPSR